MTLRLGRALQVGGLLVLSAVGAELLAAYDDNTGKVGALLFAVVFFAALYGAPALLIREVARRASWGWPSIIMLAFALGILQPGVIDQALFSADYRDIEGWAESRRGTFIETLGFSASMAQNFVLGHVIYSFCAPIAIAEAWRLEAARRPWLGVYGTLLAAALYVGAAALVMSDAESTDASAGQITASLLAAGLFVGGAAWLGRRVGRGGRERPAPGVGTTVAATLALAAAASVWPETWTGFAIGTTVTMATAVLLVGVSRQVGWSVRHAAAVAFGYLLCRGLLAFSYFPLIGEVSATRKYTHNVVMLAVVVIAGWLAVRRR